MGQSKWMWGCALFVSLACAGRLIAQEASGETETAPAQEQATSHSELDAAARIEKVLDGRLRSPLNFTETPLTDVATLLSEQYNIPIIFDDPALEAVAFSPDAEVSIRIANVSLRSALELLLKSAGTEDLTYIIDREVLLITTQEEAEQRLEVLVYRVDDLVAPDASPAELDRLIDIIVDSVDRESWAENGTGAGEINSFAPAMLIVATTHRVHQQLDRLLDRLRQTKAAIESDHADEHEASARRPVTRAIRVRDATTATPESRNIMGQTLQRSVDWSVVSEEVGEDKVFLHVLPDRVLVRHLPAVVRQVESVIDDISLPSQGGFGGGGDGAGGGGRGGGFF